MWQLLIDGCYCICLESRNDRYIQSQAELRKIGLAEKTKYYRPKKHATCGTTGAWQSHLHVMRQARKKGQKYVLVFEDDLLITKRFNHTILYESLCRFQKLPDHEADILFLGHLPFFMKPYRKYLWKTHSLMAHAYIINTHSSLVYRLLSEPHQHTSPNPIDVHFLLHARAFAVYPNMIIQRTSVSSDIQSGLINKCMHFAFSHIHAWEKCSIFLPYCILVITCFLFFFSKIHKNGK